MKKFLKVYAIAYIVMLHVVGIYILAWSYIDLSKPVYDIIARYVIAVLVFAVSDLFFLIPSAFLLAAGTFISIVAAGSMPILFVAKLFGYCTSDYIQICVAATPIGVLNLISLRTLKIF